MIAGASDDLASGIISLKGISLEQFSNPYVQQQFLVTLCGDPSFNYTQLTKCNIASFSGDNSSVVVTFEVSNVGHIAASLDEINFWVQNGTFAETLQVCPAFRLDEMRATMLKCLLPVGYGWGLLQRLGAALSACNI